MAKKQLNDLAISAFCEGLAMMLGAGIPLDEAVALLCVDAQPGPLKAMGETIHERLLLGDTLAAAAAASEGLPAYAVKMIAAGELAGRTEAVLASLARYYEAQHRLQAKLKSAVVYPTVLLGLMAAILVALVAGVLPVFAGAYRTLVGDIASSAYSYIQLAYSVGWVALGVTLVLALTVGLGALAARTPQGRTLLSNLFQKLPFTARATRQLAVARFTSALGIFIASGVDVDTALSAAGGMTLHGALGRQVEQCQAQMAGGAGLATAIYDQRLFEPLYGRMLLSAERSGNLETALTRLEAIFNQDANEQMDRLIDSIEPLLAGFLTVSVGVTLLSAMLPLIAILGSVG